MAFRDELTAHHARNAQLEARTRELEGELRQAQAKLDAPPQPGPVGARLVVYRISQATTIVGGLAAAAGFIGTVAALLVAFYAVSSADPASRASELAGAIDWALVLTGIALVGGALAGAGALGWAATKPRTRKGVVSEGRSTRVRVSSSEVPTQGNASETVEEAPVARRARS